MSKLAHTAGPWEAVGRDVSTARGPDGRGGFLVAECSLHQAARWEDARLIAQAPAMYEALRAIAAFPEGPEITASFDEPHAARIARAVLAKIEGPTD